MTRPATLAALLFTSLAAGCLQAAPPDPLQTTADEAALATGTVCHLPTPYCGATGDCETAATCCAAEGDHMCGAACVDFQTDANNCGACGNVCTTTCGEGRCAVVETVPLSGGLDDNDVGIAANSRYVLVNDDSNLRLLDSYAFYADVTASTELAGSTLVMPNGTSEKLNGLQNLFKELLFQNTDINVNKALNNGALVPCDWTDAFSSTTAAPANLKLGVDGNGVAIPWVTNACTFEVYDPRVQWDQGTGRWWIMTHARNRIWTTSCDVAATAAQPGLSPTARELAISQCAQIDAEATRFTLVAVSKTADPTQGFYKYLVQTDDKDQPQMRVHDGYAFFWHHGAGSPLHVYDAKALAAGPGRLPARGVDINGFAQPASGSHLPPVMPPQLGTPWTVDSDARMAKQYWDQPSTVDYLLDKPAGDATALWILTFTGAHGATIPAPNGIWVYTYPAGIRGSTNEATFEAPYLYWTETFSATTMPPAGLVRVYRLDTTALPPTVIATLPQSAVTSWDITPPIGTLFGTPNVPTIEVTADHDVVVTYSSATLTGENTGARYSTLYHDGWAFTPSPNVALPSALTKPLLDYTSSVRDAYNPDAVWALQQNGKGLSLLHVAL